MNTVNIRYFEVRFLAFFANYFKNLLFKQVSLMEKLHKTDINLYFLSLKKHDLLIKTSTKTKIFKLRNSESLRYCKI